MYAVQLWREEIKITFHKSTVQKELPDYVVVNLYVFYIGASTDSEFVISLELKQNKNKKIFEICIRDEWKKKNYSPNHVYKHKYKKYSLHVNLN